MFNSFIFLVFAVLFFSCWHFARKKDYPRWIMITTASLIFYGWWDWRFLFLILGTGLVDYIAALAIVRFEKYRKPLIVISMLGNIGSLMIFKYSLFFAENLDLFVSNFGIEPWFKSHIPEFTAILPVGISFYTFNSMSYTIDVYRRILKPVNNVLHFFSFISLFPHLVAGPIVRAKDFLPQLTHCKKITESERWHAVKLIAIGYFKKVFLADNIAPFVNSAFGANEIFNSSFFWWIAMLGFAFQIYFDFSGYTDIARGIAKLMGFRLRLNFNHPYISVSIKEFWTRWHISLSTWFRDYVYIPLGGSKKGKIRGHFYMWVTMLVSGFWHGAAYTYIIWGALHAGYLSAERIFKWPKLLNKNLAGRIAALIITMFLVLIAWVFFRAVSVEQAMKIIAEMLKFNLNGFNIETTALTCIVCILTGIIIEAFFFFRLKHVFAIKNKKTKIAADAFYVALLITITVYFRGTGMQFIYFQF